MNNEKINKSFLNILSPPSFYRNLAITQLIKYSDVIYQIYVRGTIYI